ncbi:hypothetical protein C8J55DRAFT_485917 [Lentinula edodes]|uniref:Uncharacterized protein n=1 Tax=Lentinula lateritia TaxID=40482 RepID=A0A9W9DYH7_9AGAR|nr:hypothetical protein C8J55DRAFT_485917 [Lentinula edodes]
MAISEKTSTKLQKAAETSHSTEALQPPKLNETSRFGGAPQDESDNPNDHDISEIPRFNAHRFIALGAVASDTFPLPKILFNAGTLSYVLFSIKLLWKVSTMFRNQPHAVAIGFVTPGVAIFTLVQRSTSKRVQVLATVEGMDSAISQIAVDITMLTGAFTLCPVKQISALLEKTIFVTRALQFPSHFTKYEALFH